MSLLRAYSNAFDKRPYLTLLLTNCALSGLGDLCAQTLTAHLNGGGTFDAQRTLRFATYGAAMGPLGGAWNKFLEVNFPLRQPVAPLPTTANPPHARGTATPEKMSSPIPGMPMPRGSKLERGTFAASDPVTEKAQQQGAKPDPESVSLAALGKRVACDQLGMAPISLAIFLFAMSLLENLDYDEMMEKFSNNYWPILLVNWQVWPILQTINFRYIPLKYRVPFGSLCGIAWTCFLSLKTNAIKED